MNFKPSGSLISKYASQRLPVTNSVLSYKGKYITNMIAMSVPFYHNVQSHMHRSHGNM